MSTIVTRSGKGSPLTHVEMDANFTNLNTNKVENTDTIAVNRGGTGGTTASDARTNLGLVIGTDVLAPNGSAASLTSFPTFNQNTTGTASNVTGTVAIANGGTGATTAPDARTNLGLGTAAVLTAGAANGAATLDAGGTVPLSQIPASITGGVSYQGTWNATTNTPTLTSSVGTKGYYYVVSVAGSTNLNGITDWKIGDWAIFNGSVWEKVDNTEAVTSVNGLTGTVTLSFPLAKQIDVFIIADHETYTAPANTQWVKVTCVGSGGSSAGATNRRSTGGGGGGVAIKWLAMTAGQTLTHNLLAGGAATVSSGTLTITTITGGAGGAGTTTAYSNSVTYGPAGGTASGGDININGGSGGNSYGSSTSIATNHSGAGGNCPGFGSGGSSLGGTGGGGSNGTGFGGGGGGSHGVGTTASGAQGVIIFEAY